ncbi:glycoside hydrolase family 17 protein [Whalleya microplaca]|nr:glycoside hydrolase family 17 protein [Whalleya microplaca]
MRLQGLVSLGLAAPAATQLFQGFNYGATDSDGSCRGYDDFWGFFERAKDLASTEGHFTAARLYTSIQCGSAADPISAFQAAIDTDMHVLAGLWASAGRTVYENELNALIGAAKTLGTAFTDHVISISVGSEDLYRSSPQGVANNAGVGATGQEIEDYIGWMRDWLRGTPLEGKPIGHIDTYVASSVDFLGHNSFPYFENMKPNTGWPFSGLQQRDAVASAENARNYYSQVGYAVFGQRTTFWYTFVRANTSQADIVRRV